MLNSKGAIVGRCNDLMYHDPIFSETAMAVVARTLSTGDRLVDRCGRV